MAPTSRPYYESKFALNELPTEMPTDGMAARHVQATIVDQHELDFPEKLNTSSYVTVVEEPEDHKAPRNFISAQADPSTPMFRVVVKANLSMPMADNLVASIAKSFAFLDAHGAGFNSHPHHAHQPHHKAC